MSVPVFINEKIVLKLLNWDSTFKAIEVALTSVVKKRVFQNARTFTKIQDSNDSLLLTMPGCLQDEEFGALACKLVTVCPDNQKLGKPTIIANIAVFDVNDGSLKAVISATEITKWRTAAASAVATKRLNPQGNNGILAILGAGTQGKIHAIAFQHFFQFKEIRIWNRTFAKAENLVRELNENTGNGIFRAFESNEMCVKGADVIVTATFASEPIVHFEWLKQGAHINAIGAGTNHHSELSESIYLKSDVFIDHLEGANRELIGLLQIGVNFKGEIGGLITGDLSRTSPNKITIFQSLGMAAEDCAMARLICDLYKNKQADN